MATWGELVVLPRRLTNGELLWLAFVTVQALDGMLSYVGVRMLGAGVEANPLLASYLGSYGPATVFLAAKLFAVGCGAILHLTDRHQWVGGLTAIYMVFAIGPWLHIFDTHPHF